MTLYLFQYNNYYNRTVKGYDSIDDYPDELAVFPNIQFNPNDGYSTSIILNTQAGDADYLIAVNEEGEIDSRWFVMEAKRQRAGQYHYILQRDVIYDYKDEVVAAPCFIEKAELDVNNPLIYNKENFSTNQIKQSEYLLKDKFGLPWAVAYIKKETANKTINLPLQNVNVDYIYTSLDQYEYYPNRDGIKSNGQEAKIYFQFYTTTTVWPATINGTWMCCFDADGNPASPQLGTKVEGYPFGVSYRENQAQGFRSNQPSDNFGVAAKVFAAASNVAWRNYQLDDYVFPNDPSYVYDSDLLWNEDGKVIFESTSGKYYKIKVRSVGGDNKFEPVDAASALGERMRAMANGISELDSDYKPYIGFVAMDYTKFVFEFEELELRNLTYNIPSGRQQTNNAPYDILTFPIGDYSVRMIKDGNDTTINVSGESVGYQLAAALAEQLGELLLDVQLLPYSAINPLFITGYKELFLDEPESSQVGFLTDAAEEGSIYSTVFYVANSSFTSQLYTDNRDLATIREKPLVPVNFEAPTDAISMKVVNETQIHRIVSPNYNSIFEISLAKNKGLKNLRADATYRPFTPYIRIYPEYRGLYGSNFGDNRGMIMSGDFSLPRTSNEWINYQLQNKNFMNAFDRQIDNLEFTNDLALREARWGVATGGLSSATTLGIVGGSVGGPIGAGIGAGLGAAASIGAGLVDLDIMKKRQAETLDYTKDMFGYQLGNIKARTSNVVKISAFDINSKIWPFIEVYGATWEEENALREKLKWNGMTVMTISTIAAFLKDKPSYIKGRIIRLDIKADYMITTHIAEEINKGVYI